jgi:hypothetical protein
MGKDIIWASRHIHSLVPNSDHFDPIRYIRNDSNARTRSKIHEEKSGWFVGNQFQFPLEKFQLLELIKSIRSSSVIYDLLQSRIKQELSSVTGLSKEVRTYQEFLAEHYGAQFVTSFWEKYILNRWGTRPENLSAQFARLFHCQLVDIEEYTPEDSHQEFGKTVSSVSLESDEQEITLNSEMGSVKASRLFIDAPIHEICSLVGKLPTQVEVSLGKLRYLDQKWVSLEGSFDSRAIHFLDDSPVFSVIPNSDTNGIALLRNTGDVSDSKLLNWAEAMGYKITDQKGCISNFTPIWEEGTYTCYLHVLEFLVGMGIIPIGVGSFGPCSSSQQHTYIQRIIKGGEPSDCHRGLFDRFVNRVSIRKMILN